MTEPHVSALGIFSPWRLWAYGGVLAAAYAIFLLCAYHACGWLLDNGGVPVYADFTCAFIAGVQALQGNIAALYDPAAFAEVQHAWLGVERNVYPNWPYPPTYFLILAPLALLPYVAAYLSWDLLTLLACVAVVYAIVRRAPAIVLVLASPFTAWNLIEGQSGLLTASLLGVSLLVLQRRPALAGVFIGCLSVKPHLGIMLPVALAAAGQWRAFGSAAVTVAVLAGASIAAFGADAWTEFPRELRAQTNLTIAGPGMLSPFVGGWAYLQTVYALIRALDGSATLAWFVQCAATFGMAAIVWVVWRSAGRYELKAATLSAAVLLATPYAYAYDLTMIAVPLAFLAKDQMQHGLLRGEQTILIAAFAASGVILLTLGYVALGPVIMIALLAVILLRSHSSCSVARPLRIDLTAGAAYAAIPLRDEK